MFADDDLAAQARAMGIMIDKFDTIQFKHNWKCYGEDATYVRNNKKEAWITGQRVMNFRRVCQFDTIPPKQICYSWGEI